jgi:hypothetical protein
MDRVFSEDATAEGQEVKKALSGERRGEEVSTEDYTGRGLLYCVPGFQMGGRRK